VTARLAHHHPLHHLHDGHPFEPWLDVHQRLDPAQLESAGAPTWVRRLAFVSAVMLAVLVSIDLTIVNLALPSILGDLDGGVETAQWVASIYALTCAIFLLPSGRFGDVIGHRRVFLAGGVTYTAASLAAALAPSAAVVIVARGLQGVGAGMVSPAIIALVARVFPPERRNVAFGTSAAALAVASGLGPLVGGAITDAFGWRWVFGIGVVLAPIPVLGMLIVPRNVDRPTVGGYALDLGGMALLALGVGGIQFGLIESGRLGWWPVATAAVVVAAAAGSLLVRRDRGRSDGFVDVRLFRSHIMNGALVANFLSCFGYYGMLVYIVLFLQGTMALSAFQVGLVLLVPALVGVGASPIVGKLLSPVTTRPLIVAGIVFEACGIFILATLDSTSSPGLHVVPGLLLNSLGFSMASVPTKVAPLDDLQANLYGRASALIGTVGKIAAGLGVAVSAAVFQAFSASEAESTLDGRGLKPPLTVADVQTCLGVDDLHACVDGLAKRSSQIADIHRETVVAVISTFEGTLNSTLVTMGAISLVGSVLVWLLLRPRRRLGDPA
jgi:EmrB/QacA subfamily drug resistance transporter